MDSYWNAVIWSLLPTVVVAFVFYVILRSIIRADRNERRIYARVEAKERARLGLPPRQVVAEPAGAASAVPGETAPSDR
ncbi:hypothetical protein ACFC3F_14510 [Microbacterium sp. NPDC055910]|uniref:hypothetical protein n=1 Tax=Microbacterium sp. NPDC055910 TaxID=3345659 RepID=UPI0035D7CA20